MKENASHHEDSLDLDGWLESLADGFGDSWSFPSDPIRDEYLDSVSKRSEREVREVLRGFLMPSGRLGLDVHGVASLKWLSAHDPDAFRAAMEREYNRRLMGLDPNK